LVQALGLWGSGVWLQLLHQLVSVPGPMAETIGVMVPLEHIAKVIGKGGTGLKQIREATGVKVQAQHNSTEQNDYRRVNISGGADQIAAAFQLLVNKAFTDPSSGPMVLIPADRAGQAVGRAGENLRRVRQECGVRINLEREPVVCSASGKQERQMSMTGEVSQLGRALCYLLGGFNPATMQPGVYAQVAARVGGCAPLSMAPGIYARAASGFPSSVALPVHFPAPTSLATPGLPTNVRPPSSDPDEMQLHLSVPEQFAGALLGKAGSRLKQTGTAACCRVTMSARDAGVERRAVIIGTYNQCETAQTMLHGQLIEASQAAGQDVGDITVVMLIRKEAAGAVIGKQGTGLKSIREQSGGARVQLAREELEGQRPVTITGPLTNVLVAERLVLDAARQPMPDRPVLAASEEDEEGYSNFNGAGSYTVAAAGAGPYKDYDRNSKRRDRSFYSPTVKRQRVDEPGDMTKILVPSQSAGAVIGKHGSGLREIRETTGTHIEVLQPGQAPEWPNDRVVILFGPEGSRNEAVLAVLKMIQESDGSCSFKLLVTSQQAGGIIGRQGSTLKRIRQQCGISVHVERDEVMGERLVMVAGDHHTVCAAAMEILKTLDEQGPGPVKQPNGSPAHHRSTTAFRDERGDGIDGAYNRGSWLPLTEKREQVF